MGGFYDEDEIIDNASENIIDDNEGMEINSEDTDGETVEETDSKKNKKAKKMKTP